MPGILMDLDHVLAGAKPYIEADGVADRPDRRRRLLQGVPPGGGDAYVMKHIIHDWDDERAAPILRAIHAPWDRGAPARSSCSRGRRLAGNVPGLGRIMDLECCCCPAAAVGRRRNSRIARSRRLRSGPRRLTDVAGVRDRGAEAVRGASTRRISGSTSPNATTRASDLHFPTTGADRRRVRPPFRARHTIVDLCRNRRARRRVPTRPARPPPRDRRGRRHAPHDRGAATRLAAARPPARASFVMGNFLRAAMRRRRDAVVASFALHHVRTRREVASLPADPVCAHRGGVLVSVGCNPVSRDPAEARHSGTRGRASAAHLLATPGRRLPARWSKEDVYVPRKPRFGCSNARLHRRVPLRVAAVRRTIRHDESGIIRGLQRLGLS